MMQWPAKCNAVKQQLGSVQAQLDLGKICLSKTKKSLGQHIGTEVQLLQAKTNVETLQNQLKAIQAQVETRTGAGKSKQCLQQCKRNCR